MFKIIIDPDQCKGCELCINDCLAHDLELREGKAVALHQNCFTCGHCIAICPQQAVSVEHSDMSEIKDFEEGTFTIEPETFLNVVKFRRSVRHFWDKAVEREKIEKIIEAGRYTETASNSQGVSYIVVQKEIPRLSELATKQLGRLVESGYNLQGLNLEEDDFLFRKAPVLLITITKNKVDAGLAASNMEIMAVTQGLGAFFIGFFVRIANQDQEIKEILEIKPGEEIITCMAVGYPKVKYYRTVPRKKAKIRWK